MCPGTALIFQQLMKKVITPQQWIALALLLVGSCLGSLSGGSPSSGELYVTSTGVAIMLVYGTVSGAAGVYNEHILKEVISYALPDAMHH